MDKLDYRGNESHSETDDTPNCLRHSRTAIIQTTSPSWMDALRGSREQDLTPEIPLSRSLSEHPGMLRGSSPDTNPTSKRTMTSALYGRSNFVPMDSRSLGASIKREENWSQRSRSPSRKPHRLTSIRFSICEPSTTTAAAEESKALSQSDEYSFSGDFDELGASDEEESKSFLLGVSTPTTLRSRKLRMSLRPVHESHDEFAKENCTSGPENN